VGNAADFNPSPACGPPSAEATARRPKALGLPSALRPRAFWRRAEAFAQAGRRAKSTRSMLPAFDFSVALTLPLSWPTPQRGLPRYAVAGAQVMRGSEDDAAMLATASSRLGRGTTGANRAQQCEPRIGQNVSFGRTP
jgi:hypothetical protein